MVATTEVLANAHQLVARAGGAAADAERPPVFKAVGIALAIASGVFIGTSFVLKKMGLLKANVKYNEEAGEGYGYLKNVWWWSGMTLMIIGEICNFAAYAFVDAILVTPLGALSVVITTILSAIFLKERLSFVGKVGCFNCIIGSIVIAMNAPEQSAISNIEQMKEYVVTPGFLTFTGVIVIGSTFIALWVAPRYGKKSMFVYISICSLIGGLSVVCTQGLGVAIIAQARGEAQFNQWFLYVVLVFVVVTLLVEIIYLNKALNLFNAALVTPTYYVFFTSATIVTSAILFQGFKGTPINIATVIMGFLQICAGVVLLQMSKSAKDVPDAAIFKGDLDQIREIGEQEQPESEPKADAIRGTAALIRRISVSRQKKEEEEAKRYHEEKMKDQLEPVAENEIVEWDGLRRRKTIISDGIPSPLARRKTIHPPLGMSRFPDESEQAQSQAPEDGHQYGFFEAVRSRASSVLHPNQSRHPASDSREANGQAHTYPVALADIKVSHGKGLEATEPGSLEEAREHIYGLPPGLLKPEPYQNSGQNSPRSKPLPAQPTVQSPAGAPNIPLPSPLGKSTRRQFSFQNMFRSPTSPAPGVQQSTSSNLNPPPARSGIGSRTSSAEQRRAMKTATEEERLGLVKGDSHAALLDSDLHSSDHDSDSYSSPPRPLSHELEYPYAAPTQDSVESSPEAHTPLVPKHSYLLSSSTIADHAPFYKELQTPTYRGSGHGSDYPSAPPPPLQEEEAGVDYDDWQIPSTRREPQPPRHPYPPPTPRFPPHPSPTASSPPPSQPSLPSHENSQLPAYHNTNPFSQPQQLRHIQSPPRQQQQHLHEPAQAKAPPAVGSDPFPNTPTTQLKNMITDTISSYKNTTSAKHRGSDSSSRPLSQEPAQSPAVQSSMEPPVGIRVTSPDEVEYEEQRKRFANKKNQQSRGQSKSRGGDREREHEHEQGRDRDGGAGAAGGAGAGAFI